MSLENMRKDVLENQQALEERRQQAEEALRVKGDFLSNMSHELRTPLNAILGMTEVLTQFDRDDEHQGEYQSCVFSIKRAGQHLLELINDVLDLAKLEAGKVTLRDDPISISMLLEEMRIFYKNLADKNGNVLSVTLEEDFPSMILSDAKILRQIITNLTGNAIKFTKNGQVTMGAKLVGNGKMNLYVKDTGIGISEKNLSLIFDQFKQVEEAHTKNIAGTGLGLAICLQLSKLLGGELSVESSEGEGTLFSLKFRPKKILRVEKSQDVVVADTFGTKPLSILVVEDNEDNLLLLTMYFRKLPHEVVYCENGQLGLEAFQAQHDTLDMVISDMQMPVMDGYASVAAMRTHEAENSLIRKKIVALTAFAEGDDEQRCLDAGCDAVYHKPISKRDFKNLLEKERLED
jgi:CheY-like chemotaxis protein